MRYRIFKILEKSDESDYLSAFYDCFMLALIVVSLIPLAFKTPYRLFTYIEVFSTIIFCVDYLLRWMTADYKLGDKTFKAFLKYPFTPMAIIDLLSILPAVTYLNDGFKAMRLMRLIRALRVFTMFRALRYSNSFRIIGNVMNHSKDSLMAVCGLAVAYVFGSALVVFNVEPETFDTFFDAIYWATVSLTTVGYGDIYPVSTMGKVITMFSSVFGIAIVALPASVITAGYMTEVRRDEARKKGEPYDQTEDAE